MSRFGQLPEGGAGAFGPMDAGGVGNGTVAYVVVGLPSITSGVRESRPVRYFCRNRPNISRRCCTLGLVARSLTYRDRLEQPFRDSERRFVMVLVQVP